MVCALAFAGLSVAASPGISPDEIKLGQTAALEGPAKALGRGMRAGLEVAIQQINDEGGVSGRKLRLVSRDDGYEPENAARNARELIEQEQVFALIGGVGTPTAAAIVPLCTERGVPFVGAFTGAHALRRPYNPLIVNVRASYAQEMERLTQLLVDEQGLKRIACFHQDDAYGQAGLKALIFALKKRGIDLVETGLYPRNTTNVSAAAVSISQATPEAVVMVGTYGACAEFIRLGRKLGLKETRFCNISFVGTRALVDALGSEAEGVIISQVMPHPDDQSHPLVRSYRAALARYAPDVTADWISLEGYAVGQVFAALATRAGPELTREALIAAASAATEMPVAGLTAAFGPDDNQALDAVYLTLVKDGKVVPYPDKN